MQRQDYCVYNQTNECFLSLGATLGDRPFARLKNWIGLGRRRVDEGTWFRPYEPHSALTLFITQDLVYLDALHRVVHIVESFPALRSVPPRPDALTLLALPVHTILSSQTKAGNQLLICAPAEMERKLRKLFEPSLSSHKRQPSPPLQPSPVPAEQPGVHAALDFAQVAPASNRRSTRRVVPHAAPRTESSPVPGTDVGKLFPHAIRDLSANGLYLVTGDRWPIGAEINMSLQPSGGVPDPTVSPITVRMRVTRWGSDGVGLEFAGAAIEATDLKSIYVC